MADMLLTEIEDLSAKKGELQSQYASSTNIQERQDIIDAINKIEKKLTGLRTQQDKEQAIEEKIHKEAVPFAIEGVDFKTLPTSLIKVVELVVKADRKRIFAEHAVELEQVEQEAEEEIAKFQQELSELKQEFDEVNAAVTGVRKENEALSLDNSKNREFISDLKIERDDLSTKLANAAVQIEEKDKEIARLKSEIDDYQKAKAYGEREAQSIIDVNPNDAEEINNAIKEFLNAEDWGSIIKVTKPDETFELVKREEFNAEWQKITPPSLGGSDNAAETFQGEGSEGDVSDGGVSAPEVPGLDFRNEEEGTVQANSIPGAVATGNAEILYRLERLEIKVFGKVSEVA